MYLVDIIMKEMVYYLIIDKFVYLNDLYAIEVETLVWRKVKCHGDIPPARYGHSLCLLGSRVFIFGGRGDNKKYFNDIYMMDLDTYIWAKISTSTSSPLPRMNHTAVMVGTRMAIFGGYNGRKTFDDFWVFNTGILYNI